MKRWFREQKIGSRLTAELSAARFLPPPEKNFPFGDKYLQLLIGGVFFKIDRFFVGGAEWENIGLCDKTDVAFQASALLLNILVATVNSNRTNMLKNEHHYSFVSEGKFTFKGVRRAEVHLSD